MPGGRQESNETALEGVVREVREETGIRVEVTREVGTILREAPSGDTYVIRDFLCSISGDARVVAGDDAAEAAFFDVTDLGELATSDGLVDALRGWGLLPSMD